MLPFSVSIAVLSLAQGATVAVPRAWDAGRLARLRGRRWALVPPASVIGFVLVASLAEQASADGLTYLALVAVPVLAALALGWLAWNADPPRPARALLAIPLFALAWADRGASARGGRRARAVGAQLCGARGDARGGHAPALAGGRDRGDGGGRHRAGRLRSACSGRTTR